MQEEIVERLLAINRDFYLKFATSFAETRAHPQPGFYQLIESVEQLATEEEIAAVKEHLSQEAKHKLMRSLLGRF